MAARSIGSVTLLFGLVAIPTKIFTAQAPNEISFNRLVKATGARVKQQVLDSSTLKPVERVDLIDGYEHTPDQFVTFTPEEMKALEAESHPDSLRIREIVPLASVDSRFIGPSKVRYLGPAKGADRAYALIASLLEQRGAAAIGQWGGERRDELVMLIVRDHALVTHTLLYADEVRSIAETVGIPASFTFVPEELQLAGAMLDDLSMPTFDVSRHVDRGAARVKAAVEKKVAGKEIVVAAPASTNGAAPLQLLEQLRLSVATHGRGKRKGPSIAKAPASEVVSRRRARSATA